MSGGHFDYRDYCLNEFVETLREDIREATSPRPEKVLFHLVSITKQESNNCWSYLHTPDFVGIKDAYEWLKDRTNDLEQISENDYKSGDTIYRIRESTYMDYPDHNWRLELKNETIDILKDTIKEIETLSEKLHLIDYVLSGDSNEDDLIEQYGGKSNS